MITRQTKLQLLVFALIAAFGLSYTGLRYAGLGKYVTDQGYLVSADFVDSGGIFKGAEVTYRGVPTGKVEELELRDDGVRVVLRLEPGTRVPDSVKAVVGNRSAVGEQYVDLQPTRDGAPFLAESAVIPQSMTAIPIQPTTLLVNLDRLVTSIDTEELAIVLDELGQAFDGAGDSLQRLVDAGDALTRAATDALPETIKLIDDGKIALDTQRDVSGDFRSFNRDLASVAEQLRKSEPDFRLLFKNGTQSATVIDDLLEANRSALPVLLANLVTVAQVQKVRIPAIKQILVTYPNVVAGGFTVVPGDGTTHFGLVADGDPPPCTPGYEATQKRDPSNITLKTPNLNAYCAVKDGSTNVRGVQNAPRPAGQKPFPDNGGPYTTTTTNGAGGAAAGRPSASSQSSDSVLLGDYDPVTGSVITGDGQRLTVGSSGGAAQMLGEDSWQWLLLGPLSSCESAPSDPVVQAGPTRSPLTTALLCLLAVAVLAGAAVGFRLISEHRDGQALDDARTDAVAAARQEALNLIAVDGEDTDGDIAKVLAGATGAFKADFAARAADLKRVIAGAKVTSSDLKIVEAAVVRADADSAAVIVAADSIVKNAAKPDGSPRNYRMLIELERQGSRWLTSSLEVVG